MKNHHINQIKLSTDTINSLKREIEHYDNELKQCNCEIDIKEYNQRLTDVRENLYLEKALLSDAYEALYEIELSEE